MEQLNFDTIILGGGPAGLSAATLAIGAVSGITIVDFIP